MAIKLEDKTNALAPNGTYPYGDIQDDTGTSNGVPVDRVVYADFHQFFARLLDLSSVVINDLPDNDLNDFQYYEALLATPSTLTLANQVEINRIKARLNNGDFSTF